MVTILARLRVKPEGAAGAAGLRYDGRPVAAVLVLHLRQWRRERPLGGRAIGVCSAEGYGLAALPIKVVLAAETVEGVYEEVVCLCR